MQAKHCILDIKQQIEVQFLFAIFTISIAADRMHAYIPKKKFDRNVTARRMTGRVDVSFWQSSMMIHRYKTDTANKGGKKDMKSRRFQLRLDLLYGMYRHLKESCSLNIKTMRLKTAFFHPRYVVKLGSVVYPALIGHSFPSK